MLETVCYDLRFAPIDLLYSLWPAAGVETTYNSSVGVRIEHMHFCGYSLYPHAILQLGRLRGTTFSPFYLELVSERQSSYTLANPIQLQPGEKIGLKIKEYTIIGMLSLGIETDPRGVSIYKEAEKPFRRDPPGPPAGEPCSLLRLLGGCD